MQTCRFPVRLAALAGSLALAGSALAVGPAHKAPFKGSATGAVTFATSFKATDPLSFSASANGQELVSFRYTDTVCDLASTKVIDVGEVKVGANGTFSVAGLKSAPEPDAIEDGHKIVTTTAISGKFLSPTKATGTLQYSQRESNTPPSHCGPIKLTFTATAP